MNKSAGVDKLYPRVLKELAKNIAYPLKLIYESSLRNSTLPGDWRSANISAILKR